MKNTRPLQKDFEKGEWLIRFRWLRCKKITAERWIEYTDWFEVGYVSLGVYRLRVELFFPNHYENQNPI
jgi:hypothetical protein